MRRRSSRSRDRVSNPEHLSATSAVEHEQENKGRGTATTAAAAAAAAEYEGNEEAVEDVQFEDPLWWQHLPSLKCIALACLLADDAPRADDSNHHYHHYARHNHHHRRRHHHHHHKHRPRGGGGGGVNATHTSRNPPRSMSSGASSSSTLITTNTSGDAASRSMVASTTSSSSPPPPPSCSAGRRMAESDLLRYITSQTKRRRHFELLAKCIGLSRAPNSNGQRGDLSPFSQVQRLEIVSGRIFSERIETDTHALALEDCRNWGVLRTDSSSFVIQDHRSKAFQLLTIGDPRVVTTLCNEAWQGENSTILPLNVADRNRVLQTSNDWILSDLDVRAFSYTPLPQTYAQMLGENVGKVGRNTKYLMDNSARESSREKLSPEWAVLNKQIFLGVLGSSVIPRKEIEKLLEVFSEAGVRFVYFSPRNMRRTKELASQMGIDVAWNCAISLRPLEEGEDDPHRMTSNYADWDVNAKLPHGIEAVRKHLKEVDNVPLLVSLFTDATKQYTADMIDTFQEYNDTVVAVGLSHISRNANIFSVADLAIGVDMISNDRDALPPHETEFVTALNASSCVFRLRGPSSTAAIPSIIGSARMALEAATNSTMFVLYGCTSFALYAALSLCAVSTSVPYVPPVGAVLYLQVILPLIGLLMGLRGADHESMKTVPPKNDEALAFAKNEGYRLYQNSFIRALPPAVLPQLLHIIVFGELMLSKEADLVESLCGSGGGGGGGSSSWVGLVRCGGLSSYSGPVRAASGVIVTASMAMCVILASGCFVNKTIPVWRSPPWRMNEEWPLAVLLAASVEGLHLIAIVDLEMIAALPWYFYVLVVAMAAACVLTNELVKRHDQRHVKRAATLRRLQFETRLGMWSPK